MKESVEENPKTQVSPLQLHREYVNGEWIDYNGHMNLAYYVLAFDHATDAFFDHLGLGVDYLKSNNIIYRLNVLNYFFIKRVIEENTTYKKPEIEHFIRFVVDIYNYTYKFNIKDKDYEDFKAIS